MTASMLPAVPTDRQGKAPARVIPPAQAGATNWAALCEIAGFAAATGTPLRSDRRGGKRGGEPC